MNLSMGDSARKLKKAQKYIMYPYSVIAIYVLITLGINLFGPIAYQDYTAGKKLAVTLYMMLFLLVTYLGMKLADRAPGVSEKILAGNRRNVNRYTLAVELVITVIFLTKLSLLLYQFLENGVPAFRLSFSSMAEVYSNLHLTDSGFNLFRKIDSLTRGLMFLAFFSGMYLWKQIDCWAKILLCAGIFIDFLYNLLYIGTQRSMFTYLVLFGMLYVVHVAGREKGIKKRNIILGIAAVAGVGILFTKMIGARYELWGSVMRSGFRNRQQFLPDHILVRWMPDGMKHAFISMLAYPTQGYYGLSLCFEVPFQWTGFLGGARGLNSIVSQIIPDVPDFLDATYPVRAGELTGFDGMANWHTIFPWLAGDVTFTGALILMMITAYIFLKCWKEVILYRNPLSFAMLGQLVILYIFLPANNQLFIERGNSLGVVFLGILWLIFHKKLNYCGEVKKE